MHKPSQYMVRILRSSDDEWADVVVDAYSEENAKFLAVAWVKDCPDQFFGPSAERYYVDTSQEIEDVTGQDYKSCNEET